MYYKMGIYSNGKVYGIEWHIYTGEDIVKSFKIIFQNEDNPTCWEIEEIKKSYYNLNLVELGEAIFRIYTSCSSTYNYGNHSSFMSWFPCDYKFVENYLNNSMITKDTFGIDFMP